jgi:hypothetical protein
MWRRKVESLRLAAIVDVFGGTEIRGQDHEQWLQYLAYVALGRER